MFSFLTLRRSSAYATGLPKLDPVPTSVVSNNTTSQAVKKTALSKAQLVELLKQFTQEGEKFEMKLPRNTSGSASGDLTSEIQYNTTISPFSERTGPSVKNILESLKISERRTDDSTVSDRRTGDSAVSIEARPNPGIRSRAAVVIL